MLSRILSIVDSYDAMTEDRPYRKGMSKQKAVQEIIDNSGTQFDPEIARIFTRIITKDSLGREMMNLQTLKGNEEFAD